MVADICRLRDWGMPRMASLGDMESWRAILNHAGCRYGTATTTRKEHF